MADLRTEDSMSATELSADSTPALHTRTLGERIRHLPKGLVAGGLIVFLIAFPLVLGENTFVMRMVNFILIYCLLSMGLNVIMGCAGLFSMGHAAFYGIGAYTSAILMTRFNQPFVICLLAATVFTGFAGLLIALPCLKVHSDFLGLITTAFGVAFNTIALHWMSVTNGPIGISGIDYPSIAGFVFNTPVRYYALFVSLVVITYVALHNILHSRVGRALYCVRDDEICATAQGINVRYYKVLAFILGTLPAGVAGSLAAHYLRFISPEPFRFIQSTKIMAMIILGGLGSLPGSIVGTVFLVILPEIFRPLAVYEVGISGLIMLLLMLFRPQGILGSIAFAGEGGLQGVLFRRRLRTKQTRRQQNARAGQPD
jgi:branched-chain amino acid transport system permease protein